MRSADRGADQRSASNSSAERGVRFTRGNAAANDTVATPERRGAAASRPRFEAKYLDDDEDMFDDDLPLVPSTRRTSSQQQQQPPASNRGPAVQTPARPSRVGGWQMGDDQLSGHDNRTGSLVPGSASRLRGTGPGR